MTQIRIINSCFIPGKDGGRLVAAMVGPDPINVDPKTAVDLIAQGRAVPYEKGTAAPGVTLEKMTIAQLTKYAADNHINIDGVTKRDDIYDVIIDAEKE